MFKFKFKNYVKAARKMKWVDPRLEVDNPVEPCRQGPGGNRSCWNPRLKSFLRKKFTMYKTSL
jgi:hypothetical protein